MSDSDSKIYEPSSHAISPKDDCGSHGEHVVRTNRFEALAKSEDRVNLLKYSVREEGQELKYLRVIELWERDQEFVDFYLSIFKKYGFNSYIWETPPISTCFVNRPFEFVLHNTPKASQNPDLDTFDQYFDVSTTNQGIVVFPNLGHDATLVVPSPYREKADYSGLAEFFDEAPLFQQRALWAVLARQVKMQLSENPMWISVAGGGISWLHIRLDSNPKYYRYMPYTKC